MSSFHTISSFLLGKLAYLIFTSCIVLFLFFLSDSNKKSHIPIQGEKNCQLVSVVDGDTVTVICPQVTKSVLTVRLQAIDAPEVEQAPWGMLSRQQLQQLVTKELVVLFSGSDVYQRYLGTIFLGKQDINQAMLEKGMARVYRRYQPPNHYLSTMQRAKEKQIGIWSVAGLHQDPQRYRRLRQK